MPCLKPVESSKSLKFALIYMYSQTKVNFKLFISHFLEKGIILCEKFLFIFDLVNINFCLTTYFYFIKIESSIFRSS